MPSRATNSSNIRIKEYNPDGPAQSKAIRLGEWEKHEARIRGLHSAKCSRAQALAALRADCGCTPHCSFSPSPSQYSTQLGVWRLRTYKPKGATPPNSNHMESSILPRSSTETTQSTPAPEAELIPASRLEALSFPRDEDPSPRSTSVLFRPVFENHGVNGVKNDRQQVGKLVGSLGSSLSNEASPLTQQADSRARAKLPLPRRQSSEPPQNVGKVNARFTASETVEDAVRRVVQELSWVLADSELEEFFDNLTDVELDELLINHMKLDEARKDALVKHTGKLLRVGEFFGPRPTRLVEIRDALERRAKSLYCSTSHTASVGSDHSVMGLTTSSFEQSPATEDGVSIEKAAAVRIYDNDTDMQQEFDGIGDIDNVQDAKASIIVPKHESVSCSACATTPVNEYKVSDDALRLWSEVNSRQDRFKALDEIRVLAGCFFAARLYADAFDLYYIIWMEFGCALLDGLAAAINCARSSATSSQDSCVEVILHQVLSAYPRDPSLFRSSQDLLLDSMLHSFLADLYENLRMQMNAEAHASKALLHLDEHNIYILQTSFSDYTHIVAALKSQIANRQRNVMQAIGYGVPTVSIDDISKIFTTDVQNNAFLDDLLAWSAKAIHENARGLDAFRSVLPKQPVPQRGLICRILLCYLIERWLGERQRPGATKDSITSKVLASFAGFVSPSEALSTIAMLIVHDCPDQHRPPPPAGRQPSSSGTLSSALLKTIKDLVKSKSAHRSFLEVYWSLMAPSGEVRRKPLDWQSHNMLCQFVMNIAPTSLVNPHLPSRGVGPNNSLVPSPDLFREFEIRPASWSNRLYSPRSSYSSGLNSVRATATKTLMNSILSLTKRRSDTSLTAMSMTSYRSSWSFGAVTGMPRASSVFSGGDMMDYDAGTVQREPGEVEMVDI